MKRLVLAAALLAAATSASAQRHPMDDDHHRGVGTLVTPGRPVEHAGGAPARASASNDQARTGNERKAEENYTVHPLTHQYGPYSLRAPR